MIARTGSPAGGPNEVGASSSTTSQALHCLWDGPDGKIEPEVVPE